MLPTFVEWWCRSVGMTDQAEIHLAIGIAAALSIFLALYVAAVIVIGLLAAVSEARPK
jgi:hypothetical protein